MIGYCLKSSQQPDYQLYVKNVTEDQLQLARDTYTTLSLDPAKDKVFLISIFYRHTYIYILYNNVLS
jgi:hypothetical protein